MGPVVVRDQGGHQPFPRSEGDDDTATKAGLEEDWELGLVHEDWFCISAVWL
jgi:hypothetical protein